MRMRSDDIAIDKTYKRRDRYEIPDWQREEVWGPSQKRKLIDSILRGWKLPKFYFLLTSEEPPSYEVVDGQQRLTTIWEFFENDLQLTDDSAREFGGAYYRDLPAHLSDGFDDYKIEFDVIEDADEPDVKEFFQRLQNGLPLTSSEKLNSSHSRLRDFAKQQSEHPFFAEKVAASNKRYGHFDIVSKSLAIEIDGLGVGLRYEDLQRVFDSQERFSADSDVARRFREALDYLDSAFTARTPALRNRSVVQSVVTLATRLVDTGRASGYGDRLAEFINHFVTELAAQVELGPRATDPDFLQFQRTVNANVRSGARTRHEVMVRKLLVFEPGFATVLGPPGIAEAGLGKQSRGDAQDILALVREINEAYAAQHGEDLFKPTNKTTAALARLGASVTDVQSFRTLIEDLYFLLWEGSGKRLEQKPRSFADVNELRNAMQHDLDHGDAAKVRAKRKRVGAKFREYAGAGTPETVAPEVFPVIHARLLAAVRRDLMALKTAYM